ncbi:hypothetical protein EV193_103318 [Herbihabitans rhizosphaerae]|uniref:Uncharacterized protein n=2 Tax=Herbihabitans rhizosphaerae TaxID=1872711 RepID=A0A4Q7KXG1_9PSEU|nr:hypothetical protein EV193_103318 [Herbihabitans rhizosphaerae]
MLPAEGSLDREQWLRLVGLLIAASSAGPRTECFAYLGPAVNDHAGDGHLLAGRLGDAAALYDHPLGQGSPPNFWPADRSWIT